MSAAGLLTRCETQSPACLPLVSHVISKSSAVFDLEFQSAIVGWVVVSGAALLTHLTFGPLWLPERTCSSLIFLCVATVPNPTKLLPDWAPFAAVPKVWFLSHEPVGPGLKLALVSAAFGGDRDP